MVDKKNRLSKKNDITNVHKHGIVFFTTFFILKYAKNNLSFSRFTILISKKVSKRAVIRNKVKRILRERMKNEFNKIRPGFDIIIIASKNSLNDDGCSVKNKELIKTINFAIKKSGIGL